MDGKIQIDLFAQDEPAMRKPRRATPLEQFAPDQEQLKASPVTTPAGVVTGDDLTEQETADVLGITRQTLRNMRVGYTNANGWYAPKMLVDTHWYKLRQTKRAPVFIRREWIDKMLEIKRIKSEL